MAWDFLALNGLLKSITLQSSNGFNEAAAKLTEDEAAEPTEVAEEEIQTEVGNKKEKVWLKTALNHYQPGILAITVGDRSGKTFSLIMGESRCVGVVSGT